MNIMAEGIPILRYSFIPSKSKQVLSGKNTAYSISCKKKAEYKQFINKVVKFVRVPDKPVPLMPRSYFMMKM